jgi:hypothetical protein
MKASAVLLGLLVSQIASADIIKCVFTTPPIGIQYSTNTRELIMTYHNVADDGGNKVVTEKDVSFQIKDAGKFELWNSAKKVVMQLDLNWKGTDGASDAIYPFDAKLVETEHFGACESNFLKSKIQEGDAR